MTRKQNDRAATVSCAAFLVCLAAQVITHSYWALAAEMFAGAAIIWFVAAAVQSRD